MSVQDAGTHEGGPVLPVTLRGAVPGPRTSASATRSATWWRWVAQLPDSALVVDGTGCVVACNPGACRCFERDVLVGRHVSDLVPGWTPRTTPGLRTLAPYPLEAVRGSESVRVLVSESWLGEDGHDARLLVLRPAPAPDGQAFFRTLVEVDPDAKVLVDGDGAISMVNRRAEEMFGFARSELLGLPASTLLPGDLTVGPGPIGSVREVTACRSDGSLFPAEVALAEVPTDDSSVVVAAVRDVSDKWFAQHRFQQLLEHAPDAKLILEVDGTISLVNAQTERLFGYRRDGLVGEQVGLLLPETLEDYLAELRAAPDPESGRRTVLGDTGTTARRADGSEFPVEVSLSVLRTDDRVLVTAAVRDLSERKMAERRFRDLLEAAPDAKVIADEAGTIVLVNQRTEQLFGWSREELVGQSIQALLPADDGSTYARVAAELRQRRGPVQVGVGSALQVVRRDGSSFPVEVTLAPLQTETGVLISVAIHDVSERVALLAESERLKSEFLATLSHELRTPLTSIMGYGEMLEDMDDDVLGPVTRRFVRIITRSAARELRLVDDLLTLVAIEDSSLDVRTTPSSVLAVVRQAVAEAAPSAREAGQEVHLLEPEDGDEDAFLAEVDEQRLVQALTNLTQNVVKHCPAGTGLVVSVDSTPESVVVRLSDDGPGIVPAESGQVFDRLFRGADAVRDERQGAGLGLPIARAIVESHGGSLTVESQPGRGACFEARLPRSGPREPLGPTA